MPDFIDPRARDGAPLNWSGAFAALPQETPPAHGWPRVAAVLERQSHGRASARRERRTNWLVGLASAAVLVLAAWSPLSHWLQGRDPMPAPAVATTEAPGMRGPAAPLQVEAPIDAAAQEPAPPAATQHDEPTRVTAEPPRTERTARAVARRDSAPVREQRPSGTAQARLATAPANDAATEALDHLKLQSAQLEALVALARDDRVGNASSELISNELDAGIAAVDAALAQADLAAPRRQELWQQRVDLLRQLAGMEATSRWLAAQGTSNETMLVAVD